MMTSPSIGDRLPLAQENLEPSLVPNKSSSNACIIEYRNRAGSNQTKGKADTLVQKCVLGDTEHVTRVLR